MSADPRRDPRRKSGAKLAEHLAKTTGGFSLGGQGQLPPEDSFMVARPGTEKQLPAMTAPHIARTANEPTYHEALESGSFMGGWGGEVEISNAHRNKALAVQAAMFGRQHAIYDVGGGRDINAGNYLSEAVSSSPQIGRVLEQDVSRGSAQPYGHPTLFKHDPSIEAEWDADRDQL